MLKDVRRKPKPKEAPASVAHRPQGFGMAKEE